MFKQIGSVVRNSTVVNGGERVLLQYRNVNGVAFAVTLDGEGMQRLVRLDRFVRYWVVA
jgi:hypothetical protein